MDKMVEWANQLRAVREVLFKINPDNYYTWVRVGMILYSIGDGNDVLLSLWEQWSRGSDKFEKGICTAKWNTFERVNSLNITALMEMAGHA